VEEEEAAVEEVAVEEEAVEEAIQDNLRHNKLSFLAKMKESWDSFPKCSTETAPKPKPSWKKSKATFASTLTSTD
jgi:hypothetical protein